MPKEDTQYLTHTLNNKERHTHEKYDTLIADATQFRGKRHIVNESDTQVNTFQKGNADNMEQVETTMATLPTTMQRTMTMTSSGGNASQAHQ